VTSSWGRTDPADVAGALRLFEALRARRVRKVSRRAVISSVLNDGTVRG
jgi:hypothetical protein